MDYLKQLMGLAFLAWPLTLLVLVGLAFLIVILMAVRFAKRTGRSKWRWGIAGFLVVFLPIFWDWIPTVVMHKYYCATEAGFWVYKTVDEWKAENPGVMETLIDNSTSDRYPNWPEETWRGMKVSSINQRFGMLYKNHFTSKEEGELFLHVWRWQSELIDKKTGEVLARRVDYSSGTGRLGGKPAIKFWLQSNHCSKSKGHANQFGEYLKQFRGDK